MTFLKRNDFYRDDKIYFTMWILFSCKWFQVRIHRIIKMNDTCLHDHPWGFITLILKGGYVEYTEKKSRILHPGRIIYRGSNFKHRLEIHQKSWSLNLMFPTRKEWGYFVNGTFVKWDQYNGDKCI